MQRMVASLSLALVIAVNCAEASAQTALSDRDIVQGLQGLEAASTGISAVALRRMAAESVRSQRGKDPTNRAPLSAQLNSLPQFSVEIVFDFDSAAIRPQSYRTVGTIADALHHPVLFGYRFLIVGHTDAKGGREYNLQLSQKRADMVREALTTTFRVPPLRVEAVGLGEEQLRDPANPFSAANRRVQIVTIGKLK